VSGGTPAGRHTPGGTSACSVQWFASSISRRAITRAALFAAEHVVIPLAPDLYSLQGLKTLAPTLRRYGVPNGKTERRAAPGRYVTAAGYYDGDRLPERTLHD
jgi:hypothetical protein